MRSYLRRLVYFYTVQNDNYSVERSLFSKACTALGVRNENVLFNAVKIGHFRSGLLVRIKKNLNSSYSVFRLCKTGISELESSSCSDQARIFEYSVSRQVRVQENINGNNFCSNAQIEYSSSSKIYNFFFN